VWGSSGVAYSKGGMAAGQELQLSNEAKQSKPLETNSDIPDSMLAVSLLIVLDATLYRLWVQCHEKKLVFLRWMAQLSIWLCTLEKSLNSRL
jgi:hypothetical protein